MPQESCLRNQSYQKKGPRRIRERFLNKKKHDKESERLFDWGEAGEKEKGKPSMDVLRWQNAASVSVKRS